MLKVITHILLFLKLRLIYPLIYEVQYKLVWQVPVSIMTSRSHDETFMTSRLNDVKFLLFCLFLHYIGSRKSSCHPYCIPYRKYEPRVDVRMEISNSASLVWYFHATANPWFIFSIWNTTGDIILYYGISSDRVLRSYMIYKQNHFNIYT